MRRLDRFVEPLDRLAVRRALGRLTLLLAGLLLVPAALALALHETGPAIGFAGATVAAVVCAVLLGVGRPGDLRAGEALVVAALAYALAAAIGALPYLALVGPLDALFEAMSGFTTTGLSRLPLDRPLPVSVAFYRGWTQWIGGAGVISLSVAMLGFPGPAARRLYQAEPSDVGAVVSARGAARAVLGIYALVTAAVIAVLALAGLPLFDAVVHGLSTASTGGFSPYAEGAGRFGMGARLALVVGMLVSSVPLIAWRRGLRDVWGDPQVRALGVIVLGGSVLLVIAGQAPGDAVVHAAASSSTTGYSVTDPAAWTDAQKAIATPLMVIGGPSGSSAGGLKLVQLLFLVAVVRHALLRAALPADAHLPLRVRDAVLGEEEVSALIAFLAADLALFVGVGLVITISGSSAIDAFFESASAIGTVGLSAGVTAHASALVRSLLIVEMWAGRLEVIPLLVLAHRVFRRRVP